MKHMNGQTHCFPN